MRRFNAGLVAVLLEFLAQRFQLVAPFDVLLVKRLELPERLASRLGDDSVDGLLARPTVAFQPGDFLAGRVGDLALDELQRPSTFFTSFTQTGCTRVQFYTYKQDPPSFGQGTRTGCLFYEYGCRGPMTHSSKNFFMSSGFREALSMSRMKGAS